MHEYLAPAMSLPSDEMDENIVDDNEGSELNSRIQKINEESSKFDMLRINQLTNSPI
jgi:hypothetical protein